MASNSSSPQVPATMAGVQIDKNGGRELLQYKTEIPVPTPSEGHVLIKNDFIGINYIDTYMRSGLYPPAHLPLILGREGSGTIVAHGPGSIPSHLPIGTRVAWLAPNGGYAEYTAAPTLHVAPIPSDISSDVAAAALLQGLTALTLIRESHHVNKGDWVLVHAAAGGVGLLLCQLLRAVGAHTIATASTEAKRELARKAGAEVLLDYTSEQKVSEQVLQITGGKGVQVVFDGVGKATFDDSLACVARKGSMISFGNASGAPDPFTIARLAPKIVRLMRPMLFSYIVEPEEFAEYAKELFGFIQRKELDIKIHDVYPLKDVARAQEDIEGRRTTGKLVLRP